MLCACCSSSNIACILRQWLDFKLSPPPHPRFPFHGLFESTLLLPLLLLSPHVGRTGGCPPSALPREEEEESGWSVLGGGREGEKGNFDGWNISEIPCSAAAAVDREKELSTSFFFSALPSVRHISPFCSHTIFSPFLKVGHARSGRRTNKEEGTSK